jgi:hypothetical protein
MDRVTAADMTIWYHQARTSMQLAEKQEKWHGVPTRVGLHGTLYDISASRHGL